MDIILATNTQNPFLALTDVERYADGSGYGCNISVRSAWLTAAYPFFFESHPLTEFIAALGKMDRTLEGEAVLKPMWEEPYIRLKGDGLGRVRVSGLLIDNGGNDQRAHFEFEADQTCLARLIADLIAVSGNDKV